MAEYDDILRHEDTIVLKRDIIGFMFGVTTYKTTTLRNLVKILSRDYLCACGNEEPHVLEFYRQAVYFIEAELELREKEDQTNGTTAG